MKINKKIKLLLFTMSIAFVTIISSCKKAYLDVTNPNVYETANFPATIDDLNTELYGLYGRLRAGFYDDDYYPYFTLGREHSADVAYNNSDFAGSATLNYNSGDAGADGNKGVNGFWNKHYENIAKCVNTINDIARFKVKNPALTVAEIKTIDVIEGQALFVRAWNYMILINYFGETMITSEADKVKMGIPILNKLAVSIAETQVPRNMIGEVWDYIIADLKKAELLLGTKTWGGNDIARISGWGVKGLLGKAYVYTQQWPLATAKLKEVIDGSGKTLVPFDIYKEIFNGKFEFNNESLVEVNFVNQPGGDNVIYNPEFNTGNNLPLLIGTAYKDNGDISKNGYGNFFVHQKNLSRFGFTGTATSDDDLEDPAYLTASATARDNKDVDPRLWVNAFQPYLDSIMLDDVIFPTAKMPGDGVDLDDVQAWSLRKFMLLGTYVTGNNRSVGNNMYLLRLADVYLLYAEALIKTGNNTLALEYINKVHRRAYDQANVNAPSTYDYASLSAATKAPDPVLKNDPLKYERWAELFGEGNWWLDVARWKLGSSEAAYYQKVAVGNLTFQNSKYALPIPIREMNANTKMVQNPGY